MVATVVHVRRDYLQLTETFIYEQLIALRSSGHFRPVVLSEWTQNLDAFPFEPIHCASALPKLSWNGMRDRAARRLWGREPYFEDVIRTSRAKLVHAHFGPDGVLAAATSRRLSVPLVTTFYGYDMSQLPREESWRRAYRELFAVGAAFLVEGNHMKSALVDLGCPEEKVRLQHIGVDMSRYDPSARRADPEPRLLFCGRLTEKKGLRYAIEALAVVADSVPTVELRVVGDGEEMAAMRRLAKERGVADKVAFLGRRSRSQFAEELGAAALLLQPSVTAANGDSEGGAPTVIIEAQAASVPVVATRHADIPEVVVDGETGILADERDVRGLADGVLGLLGDPRAAREMGRRGRHHVERSYSTDSTTRTLEDTYSSLLIA